MFATIVEIPLFPSAIGMSDVSVFMLTSEEREAQSMQTSVSESHSLSDYRLLHVGYPWAFITQHLLSLLPACFPYPVWLFLSEHPKEVSWQPHLLPNPHPLALSMVV